MPTVNTTVGAVEPASLGFTLMHEHMLFGYPAVRQSWPDSFDRPRAFQRNVAWLREAKAAGIDTIVDVTTPDNGRDIEFQREVAQSAGIQVVVATGFWEVPRFFFGRSPEVAKEFFVRDITEGIEGSNVKAGIIKVASDEEELAGPKETIFRAAARAHRMTGIPITTHTDSFHHSGLDQQRVLSQEGVDLARVVIGHSG
ncbi:MAG: phosphotriesterase, partial [Chloroflexota bacterium]|nr:phosphotriesterase [Chloroflexota bacterium]